MRKLLLASAATFGALLASTGGALAQPVTPVAPGTLVVHLNGYLQFELAGFGSTYNTVTSKGTTVIAPSTTAPYPNVATTVGAGTYKLNPVTTDGDARIYPGFDAMSRQGLGYGAQIELRTQASDAAVGAGKVSGAGSSAGTEGIYVKRAYGYIGTTDAGYVRFGQGDSSFTLLQAGVIEAFGDGAQFNADGGLVSLLPTNASPGNFIYADTSNLYATDKVVYISPAIAGFSVSAGFEPNSNGLKEGYGDCTSAATLNGANSSTVCADQSSSPISGDIGKRRKNTVDAMVSYSLKANGFVVKASGGILYGAPIDYTGAAVKPGASALAYGYDNLEVYQGGAQVTYAGLTVGANVKGGQVEDGYAFKPKGGRDALTYIVGASYVLGPVVLGGSYYNGQSAGTYYPGATYTVGKTKEGESKTLSEYGAAAGANYVVSKNLSVFLQYLYGHRKQLGNTALLNGKTQVQAIGAGATLKW
jgi:predicted porin